MADPHPPDAPGGPAEDVFDARSLRRWLLLSLATLVLGGFAYLGWRPVYERLKYDRGRRLSRQAAASLAAGDLADASRLARAALGLAPDDPAVCRVAARVCAATDQPVGITYWSTLLAGNEATREDRLEAVEMAIRFGRVDLSGPWLERAYREAPRDRRVARLMLRHLLRLGTAKTSGAFADEILGTFAGDPEIELEVGRLFVGGRFPARRDLGLRLLWGLAAGNSSQRDPAVSALASVDGLGRAEMESLVRMVGARTNAPVEGRLLALDLRVRLDADARPGLVRQALEMIPSVAEPGDAAALALWLNRHGAIAEALPLLPPDRCRTNLFLMAARLDGLIAAGRGEEIDRIAAEESDRLVGPLATAGRAVVAMRRGHPAEAEALFRTALKSGSHVPPVMLFVARQAERAGMPAIAIDAYTDLLDLPGNTLDAGREILRLAKPLDDLTVTRGTLRALNAFMPGEDIVAGERAWLEALFGDEKEFAATTLERLARVRTNQPVWRYGQALATWRRGDAAAALAAIEPSPVEWNAMEPRWQAVYVAILGANEQREVARRFARRVDISRLHAQERALLAPWL